MNGKAIGCTGVDPDPADPRPTLGSGRVFDDPGLGVKRKGGDDRSMERRASAGMLSRAAELVTDLPIREAGVALPLAELPRREAAVSGGDLSCGKDLAANPDGDI